jgi:hypothetical protein
MNKVRYEAATTAETFLRSTEEKTKIKSNYKKLQKRL